jgi:hypothetical protein
MFWTKRCHFFQLVFSFHLCLLCWTYLVIFVYILFGYLFDWTRACHVAISLRNLDFFEMNPPNYAYAPSGMGMYPVMGYGAHPQGTHQPPMQEPRDGFQQYGTFSEMNGAQDALAAMAFDPIEELIWTGNQTVRLVVHPLPGVKLPSMLPHSQNTVVCSRIAPSFFFL